MTVRLEINTTGTTWVDILGSANSITVSRSPMQLGTLTARLADVALDPSQTDTLASGRPIRLMGQTGTSTWAPFFTGKISASKVTYPLPTPGSDPNKAARIEVTAVDNMQALGVAVEPRSVHTTTNLRTLLAASGLPWRVNNTVTAGPASPVIVANNPSAFLADQIAITRDTVRGYAWVDAANTIQVYDPANMPTTAAVTYTDVVDANPSYTTVDASYDSTDIVDEVAVTFLRYKTTANATEEVPYGPYRRSGATGTNTRTYTIVGTTEDATAIQAYANAVLDRHATAVVRPLGMTTPLKTHANRLSASRAELCARVRVLITGRVDAHVRVESIEHEIQAVKGAPDPVQWVTTYTYGTPEAVPESQALAIVRPVPVLQRFENVETTAGAAQTAASNAQTTANQGVTAANNAQTTANEGVDPAATAARLTGQTVTDLQTAAAGEPRWTLGATGTRQTIQAHTARPEQTSPGGLTVNVGVSRAAVTVESPGIDSRSASLDLSSPYASADPTLATLTANDILLNGQTVNLGQVVGGTLLPGEFLTSVRAGVRADQSSQSLANTAPFGTTAKVTRIGGLVVMSGGFTRASSFSTTYATAGNLLSAFRPTETTYVGGTFFNTTVTWQVAVLSSGDVQIRMSGANAGLMSVAGLSWPAPVL